MTELYDQIGVEYRDRRRPDPRLAAAITRALNRTETVLPIPHDCVDGFLAAYWRRPHAYLDAGVRSAISTFAKTNPRQVEAGVERLRQDLDDGTWARRHGHLLDREEIDLDYRIVIAAKR